MPITNLSPSCLRYRFISIYNMVYSVNFLVLLIKPICYQFLCSTVNARCSACILCFSSAQGCHEYFTLFMLFCRCTQSSTWRIHFASGSTAVDELGRELRHCDSQGILNEMYDFRVCIHVAIWLLLFLLGFVCLFFFINSWSLAILASWVHSL